MVLRVCENDNKQKHSKTAASILNEKARRFHLKVVWNLTDEFGPPHDRTFCVKLTIACHSRHKSEVFEGIGKSIKAARQVAACVAIDRSALLNDINDQKEYKPSRVDPKQIRFLTDFIDGVPHPMGPRAELQQLAKAFCVPTNFIRLSSNTSQGLPTLTGSSHFRRNDGVGQATLHRVGLDFAGRQYVGESTTRSAAEQEASLAALRALHRALLLVTGCAEQQHQPKNPSQTEPQSPLILRPNSAVWRLRVIGKLHGNNPVFQHLEPSSSANESKDASVKLVYTSACSLKRWGTVHASGSSLKESRERAAELMLARLSGGLPQPVSKSDAPQSTDSHPSMNYSRRKLTNRNKTRWRFACDRAEAAYGQELNPVARLHFVCSAKQLPLPVFEMQSDSAVKAGSHASQGSSRVVPPEFTYQVSVGTDSVNGPPACNKRLAKRLAAEAMLTHLGFHRSEFNPGLQSALRHPRKNPSTDMPRFESSSSPLNNASSSIPIIEEVESPTKGSSSDCTDQSLQHDRHVVFSCTRDVLILDEVDTFKWKRFPSSSRRGPGLSSSNGKLKIDSNSSTKAQWTTQRQPSLRKSRSSSSLTLDNIGHWADSQEAQTVSRSINLRRSSSCLTTRNSRLNPCETAGTHSLHCLPSPTSPCLSTERLINPALRLLSQLAVFCLLEHESPHQTAVKRPTVQLKSLCQRLHIPCQFTDQPPKFDWDDRLTMQSSSLGPELYHHHTVLTIGATPNSLTLVTQDSLSSNSFTPVVVRGSGCNKDAAHDDAVIAAFRHLVRINATISNSA